MSLQTTLTFASSTVETLDGNPDAAPASNRKITWNAFDETITLNATTSPLASKIAAFLQSLTAGAATINLTAALGANGISQDLTGLKVQYIRVKNLGANDLTISTGASNGYNFGGPVVIKPGGIATLYQPNGLPAISSTVKNIDLAGTTTQQSRWIIIAG